MGGALVENIRHWCRHRWNRLNAPCVASDVVAPDTTVTLKCTKDANSNSGAQEDSPRSLAESEITTYAQKSRRKMNRSDKQMSRTEQEVEFFTEYGDSTRYMLKEVIGKGSYGVVCSAVDTHTGDKVAIKKINDIFDHVSDATRILREIKLLRLLRHPDIVELKHIMIPPSPNQFKDIYVVFELMESDLHQVIKANDDLTPEHYQFFLYQLLRALKYIHTANVFHRDLKPKNVLANADCKLKICDFGLARVAFDDAPTAIFWTDYVATRWYRAPELCGSFFSKYTPAVDIWSIGCIFAEVLLGKPLFPGKNVVHQLDLITDLLGTPTPETISMIRNDKARKYLAAMPKKAPISFLKKFPNVDPAALRLLERLLAFDPLDRPTAEEALSDPYFRGLSKAEREPSAQAIKKSEFEFERSKLSKEDARELIYREILEYHPEMLTDYLHSKGSRRFTYTSTVDDFKRQFSYLEENYSKGTPNTPIEREHSSFPRELPIVGSYEDAVKHGQEFERSRQDKGLSSLTKSSFRASQRVFQEEQLEAPMEASAIPRRLMKSASVNGAYTTSVPNYMKRNPSLRSGAGLNCAIKEDSGHKQGRLQNMTHMLGFEIAKRFQAIHSGLARS